MYTELSTVLRTVQRYTGMSLGRIKFNVPSSTWYQVPIEVVVHIMKTNLQINTGK